MNIRCICVDTKVRHFIINGKRYLKASFAPRSAATTRDASRDSYSLEVCIFECFCHHLIQIKFSY